jgi:two-component system cell cycle response regulator DivK
LSNKNGATIHFIEDNPDNRMLVRHILQAECYAVMEADDDLRAVKILNRQFPDPILMDINLPEIDGYKLTTQIKFLPELVENANNCTDSQRHEG